MVFAYVFIQGWVIDPYKHGFFDQPREVLLFPAHHCEVVNSGWMTWDVAMVKYRGGGPAWAINGMKTKFSTPRNQNNNNQDNRSMYKNFVTVPYNEGLSETFKNICKRYGIQVHFKSGKTIKDELVAPKDQDHITEKSVTGWNAMKNI